MALVILIQIMTVFRIVLTFGAGMPMKIIAVYVIIIQIITAYKIVP